MPISISKDPGREAVAILARHDVATLPVPVERIMKAEGVAALIVKHLGLRKSNLHVVK